MDSGELITRWMARVALGLSAVALAFVAAARKRRECEPLARGLWTAACGVYLVHVACAFHFMHQWSHHEAWAWTVRRTIEVTGLASGVGIWVNYVFTGVWMSDVAVWWLAREQRGRRRWLVGVWYAWFLGMAFSATVLFESGPTRWIAVAVGIVLAAVWWQTRPGPTIIRPTDAAPSPDPRSAVAEL